LGQAEQTQTTGLKLKDETVKVFFVSSGMANKLALVLHSYDAAVEQENI
jgi:hypothetical protein